MNRRLKYRFIPLLVLVCGLLLLAACNGTDITVPEKKAPVVSAPPPNTTYPMPPLENASINNLGWTLSDGTHNLFSEYKGKVLILDFYATWCKPCRTSIPHFIGLQNKYGSLGLQVIGLNVGGEEDLEKVPAFAKELGIQYPLAIPDPELVTFLLSDIDAIPQTFIFDREGKLADRVIGFGPSAAATIDEVVESALKTSAP
jgi:cytochrome c biogenesis protein CcmG/thiol:disulfide interchange protein DsbE